MSTVIHVHLIDPDGEEGVELQLPDVQFLREYYRPFTTDDGWGSAETREVRGVLYRVRPLGLPSLYFGIRADVLEWARSGKEYPGFERFAGTEIARPEASNDETFSISRDGTVLYGTAE